MINSKYAKAYVEVLEIIKYLPEEEYKKIPTEKIEFYKNNMDKDYEFIIDPTLDLSEQNISKETNAIIVNLFKDYYATDEQKEIIEKILALNEKKDEQKKREIYNPDDLFNNRKEDVNNKEIQKTALIEYKETFFTKFKNFIMKILNLKS